jgi:hypothetical protein
MPIYAATGEHNAVYVVSGAEATLCRNSARYRCEATIRHASRRATATYAFVSTDMPDERRRFTAEPRHALHRSLLIDGLFSPKADDASHTALMRDGDTPMLPLSASRMPRPRHDYGKDGARKDSSRCLRDAMRDVELRRRRTRAHTRYRRYRHIVDSRRRHYHAQAPRHAFQTARRLFLCARLRAAFALIELLSLRRYKRAEWLSLHISSPPRAAHS